MLKTISTTLFCLIFALPAFANQQSKARLKFPSTVGDISNVHRIAGNDISKDLAEWVLSAPWIGVFPDPDGGFNVAALQFTKLSGGRVSADMVINFRKSKNKRYKAQGAYGVSGNKIRFKISPTSRAAWGHVAKDFDFTISKGQAEIKGTSIAGEITLKRRK